MHVLNHSLDAAHSLELVEYLGQANPLDGLSSEQNKRRVYGPANPTVLGRGPEFLIKDSVYDNREFSSSYFWSYLWEPDGNAKQVAGFENSVE